MYNKSTREIDARIPSVGLISPLEVRKDPKIRPFRFGFWELFAFKLL